MGFLGSLGIDINLLVAQMINFGLLLWLLSKFLYKPIVEQIEKDESEIKKVREQRGELERGKKDFEKRKRREISEAKKRAREIIREAENIAAEIKSEMREEVEKETRVMIKQSRDKLESMRSEIEKEILGSVRAMIGSSFRVSFVSNLSVSSQKLFQNVFWNNFIEQFKRAKLRSFEDSNLIGVLEDLEYGAKEKSKKKAVIKEELEKILAQRAGTVTLEYVCPLTIEQEKELNKLISEKIGFKLNIDKKRNKNLISGFRFEIAGMIIESNLLSIIKDAADFTK